MHQRIKLLLFRLLQFYRLYPLIYWSKNPFKIFEFKEITRNLKRNQADIVLDLGSGLGLQTLLLRKWSGYVIGLEPNLKEEYYPLLRQYKRVSFIKEKIEKTNFKDETFEKIFSFCVLEHISNFEEVLQKCYALLKPGGSLIFSSDSLEAVKDRKLVEKHRKDHYVEEYFRKKTLQLLLEEIGFEEIVINPIFTSKYAKSLFINGIIRKFDFGYLETLIKYIRLKKAENTSHSQTEGIFLVCYATKP